MKVFAYDPDCSKDLTSDEDFPEGVSEDSFIKVEKAMIDTDTGSFWRRLFNIIERIYISTLPVFSGEFVVLLKSITGTVKKEEMKFVHSITLCFKNLDPHNKYRFVKIAEIGPDDLTWDSKCTTDIIRDKIWEKTTEAFNDLVDHNLRIAHLIKLTDVFVKNLRTSQG